jgi:uncharacterized protein
MHTQIPPTLEALRQQRNEILQIFEKHGCSNVRLFGSVARGDATSNSDVDFLYDYTLGAGYGAFPGELEEQLEQVIGSSVDVVPSSALEKPYLGASIKASLVKL